MRNPTSELDTNVLLTKEEFIEIFKTTSVNPRVIFLLIACTGIEIAGIITAFMNNMGMAIALILTGFALYMLRYMRDSWYVNEMLAQTYPYGEDDYTIRYKYKFTNDGIDVIISHRYQNEKQEMHVDYRQIKNIVYSKNYTVVSTKNNKYLYFERGTKPDRYFSKRFNRRRYGRDKS